MLSKFVLADMKPSDVSALRRDGYWTTHQIDRKDATITRVDAAGRQVHLADGTVLDYDAAVLAIGAIAKVPTPPGAKLSGVHTLRNRQDAASIVAVAAKGSRAVIVGSSFIGLEAASALHERGVHVTVVSPENVPFARRALAEHNLGKLKIQRATLTMDGFRGGVPQRRRGDRIGPLPVHRARRGKSIRVRSMMVHQSRQPR